MPHVASTASKALKSAPTVIAAVAYGNAVRRQHRPARIANWTAKKLHQITDPAGWERPW